MSVSNTVTAGGAGSAASSRPFRGRPATPEALSSRRGFHRRVQVREEYDGRSLSSAPGHRPTRFAPGQPPAQANLTSGAPP